jgi:hypothetical protein
MNKQSRRAEIIAYSRTSASEASFLFTSQSVSSRFTLPASLNTCNCRENYTRVIAQVFFYVRFVKQSSTYYSCGPTFMVNSIREREILSAVTCKKANVKYYSNCLPIVVHSAYSYIHCQYNC